MTIREARKLQPYDLIYIYPKNGSKRVIGKFSAVSDDEHFVRVLIPFENSVDDHMVDYVGACNIEKYYTLEEKLGTLLTLDKN